MRDLKGSQVLYCSLHPWFYTSSMLNRRTCCNIRANCCSVGLSSAEMTGSLCRHTAAIRVHGELALSDTLLACKVARQRGELENRSNPVFPTPVLLKQDRNCRRGRLAILPQGAAIFFCYIHVYVKKIVVMATTHENRLEVGFPTTLSPR